MAEARGPLRPRHRWSLWIVGRWPAPTPRFPGGGPLREPPFVGVSAGVVPPTRGAYVAVCRRLTGRPGSLLRRTVPWRAQWGQLDGHDGPRGAPRGHPVAGRSSPLPAVTAFCPSGGCARGPPLRRGPRARTVDTWLILPVVICLSQRLSHACLSISNLYGETANGSLNQLSFI